MSRRDGRLTARSVATLGPGKHYDEYGLYLRVSPSGRRYFEQRYTVGGKRRNAGIGRYPIVNLGEARSRALGNLREASLGSDAIAERRRANAPTFEAAARAALKQASCRWRDPDKFRGYIRTFERHVFPTLGAMQVNRIEPYHLSDLLEPLSETRLQLAHDLRSRFGTVMQWAIRQGYRSDDPAGLPLRGVLPSRYKPGAEGNHSAVPYPQVGEVLANVGRFAIFESVKHWMEFVVYTAARSGEARVARWEQIDLAKRRWIVPAPNMKGGIEHEVPLSDAALDVLQRAREFGGHDGYVFVSRRGKVHAKGRLSDLLISIQAPGVPHGFRASFRTWAADQQVGWEVAEAALAHVVGNSMARRYIRTPYYDLRVPVMQRWGEYLSAGRAAAVAKLDAVSGASSTSVG